MVKFLVYEGISNRILLSLPQATLKGLRPALELLKTARGDFIDRADRPVEYIYFPNRGLISVVKTMRDGRTVEIGVVGIEGVTDAHSLFGFKKAPSTP